VTTGERESRWFVFSAATAMLIGIVAAAFIVSPAPRTLASQAIDRLASSASAVRYVYSHFLPATHTHAATLPPGIVTGPLDGEPTPRADAQRRAIAVMIDNYYPDARPQTGISQASVVFETLVEGGYTRIMPVYLEHDPTVVGPVRSTRIYFDDWAAALHAILVHVGGNDDADAQLWQMPPVYNLDQGTVQFVLAYYNPYFWRSAARSIPDNMYANIVKLRSYAAHHGQDWRYSNASLAHKQLAPVAARGRSGTLTLQFVDPNYSTVPANPEYDVQYRFDPTSDSYIRVLGGTPQIDAGTHEQIRAQNIVVMHTGAGTADLAAGTTVDAVSIPVVGTGPAEFYLDGQVQHGTWRQKDALAPLQFLNRQGRPVKLNPGQTWIEVLPQYSSASWK
jgi:hypothetical protein